MVGAALKVLPRRLALPFLPSPPSPSPRRRARELARGEEADDDDEEPGEEGRGEEDDDIAPEPAPNPDWVPWHRVVSSSGLISPRGNPAATARQAEWLEAEGVVVRRGPGAGVGGGGGGGGGGGRGADGGGTERGDAFGLGERVEGGGRVSMATYAWKG